MSSTFVHKSGNDTDGWLSHNYRMIGAYDNDWYLTDWMAATGVSQADIIRRTDISKSKMSMLVNGHRKYHREDVNELSCAMNIEPFELLMHPADAMAIRRLRDTAMRIAADAATPYLHQPYSKAG
jgi:transcriptional regulator with XRE-family HTH domain